MNRSLGTISPAERDELMRLTERHSGLCELLLCLSEELPEDVALRSRVEKERVEIAEARTRWWSDTAKGYGWPTHPEAKWKVDYATRQVVLTAE